jgi:hypothetical protein
MPGLAVTAWTVAAGRAECDDPCPTGARPVVQQAEWCGVAGLATDAYDELAPTPPSTPAVATGCRNVRLVRRRPACADGWRAQNYGYRTGTVSVRTTVVPDPVVARIRTMTSLPFRSSGVSVTAGSGSPTATVCQVAPASSLTWTM